MEEVKGIDFPTTTHTFNLTTQEHLSDTLFINAPPIEITEDILLSVAVEPGTKTWKEGDSFIEKNYASSRNVVNGVTISGTGYGLKPNGSRRNVLSIFAPYVDGRIPEEIRHKLDERLLSVSFCFWYVEEEDKVIYFILNARKIRPFINEIFDVSEVAYFMSLGPIFSVNIELAKNGDKIVCISGCVSLA